MEQSSTYRAQKSAIVSNKRSTDRSFRHAVQGKRNELQGLYGPSYCGKAVPGNGFSGLIDQAENGFVEFDSVSDVHAFLTGCRY